MEAFNECLINIMSVLLQVKYLISGETQSAVSSDPRSVLLVETSIWISSLNQGSAAMGGTAPFWEILPHPWPQHFTAPEASLSLPIWKPDIIFHLVVFPLAQGWLSQYSSAHCSSLAVPGPVLWGNKRFPAEAVGHSSSHQLNFLPTGQWIFPLVAK